MKRILTYAVVILVCIAFCILFSHIGTKFEGARSVNPWAFTLGVLAIAIIMSIVHKISDKQHNRKSPKDSDSDNAKPIE